MDEKERLFRALDAVIDQLRDDLGHVPDDAEILTRLALMFGVYVGGFAEKNKDPIGCIERSIEPARTVARQTLEELQQ